MCFTLCSFKRAKHFYVELYNTFKLHAFTHLDCVMQFARGTNFTRDAASFYAGEQRLTWTINQTITLSKATIRVFSIFHITL